MLAVSPIAQCWLAISQLMVAYAGYSLTSGFVIASLLFCAYPSHPGVDKNRPEQKHPAHTLQNKFKVGRNPKKSASRSEKHRILHHTPSYSSGLTKHFLISRAHFVGHISWRLPHEGAHEGRPAAQALHGQPGRSTAPVALLEDQHSESERSPSPTSIDTYIYIYIIMLIPICIFFVIFIFIFIHIC